MPVFLSSSTRCPIACTTTAARPSVGSSLRITAGLLIRARPTTSIWRSPPREPAREVALELVELREDLIDLGPGPAITLASAVGTDLEVL
ncbi:MAG TPA: hypothetical protein VNG93_13585 [Candidatus Dormibacteraeota bacterium]|nr:hypothetical protein [Candidatus Dormibacteraeota bacterium]